MPGSLVGDVILVVLDHVIGPAPARSSKESEDSLLGALPLLGEQGVRNRRDLPVAEETVLDDLHNKIGSLPLCHVRAEPVSGQRRKEVFVGSGPAEGRSAVVSCVP